MTPLLHRPSRQSLYCGRRAVLLAMSRAGDQNINAFFSIRATPAVHHEKRQSGVIPGHRRRGGRAAQSARIADHAVGMTEHAGAERWTGIFRMTRDNGWQMRQDFREAVSIVRKPLAITIRARQESA